MLFNGPWYSPSGAPLDNGYLRVRLNQDATDGTNQYLAGRELNIPLDSSGGTSVTLPDASTLSPTGTVYFVTAYAANGQLVWGPNSMTV